MENGSLLNRIEYLRSKESEINTQIEKLQKLENKNKALIFEMEAMNNSMEDYKNDIEHWKDKCQDAERRAVANNHEEALKTLRDELERVNANLNLKNKEKDQAKARITDLENQLHELDDLNRTIELQKTENTKLLKQVAEKSRDNENLKKKLIEGESMVYRKNE